MAATHAGAATSAADLGGMDGAGRGRQEGGRAQRHRAARRTGPTTATSSRRFGDEVRHQGQLARSRTPPARTRSTRPSRSRAPTRAPDVFDLGPVRGAGQHRACSPPYKVADLGRHPRRLQGRRTAPGSTTTAATCRSATTRPRCPRRPAVDDLLEARSTRARSPSTATRPQAGAAFSGVLMAALGQRRLGRRHRARASTSSSKLKKAGNFLPVDPTSGDHRVRPDAGRHRLGLPERRPVDEARRQARLEGRRARTTRSSAATTTRRSTPTPRTRPPPGCGRSTSTPTRARTSGSRGGARPVRADAMVKAGTIDKAAYDALPTVKGRRSSRPPSRRTRPAPTSPRTGRRRSSRRRTVAVTA